MSKAISTELKNHMAQGVTTLAQCWAIVCADGDAFRFSDLDVAFEYDGNTYAAGGFRATATAAEAGSAMDSVTLAGGYRLQGLQRSELIAGKFDYAAIEIFTVNYADTSQGKLSEFTGRFGAVTIRDNEFEVELEGLGKRLEANQLRMYSPGCNADLGDTRCGVDLDDYRESGEVTAVTDSGSFVATITNAHGHSGTESWWALGRLEWTGGANDGLVGEVKASTAAGALTLFLDAPYAVAIGDTFDIEPGCNKSADLSTGHCKTKFANLDNFRGYPHLPGRNKVFAVHGGARVEGV